MFEQRNYQRYKTVWKVYFKESDHKYHLVGFLMDIGEGGARFFLDSVIHFQPKPDEKIKILIKPDIQKIEPKGITVKITWYKQWQNNDLTYEVGVEFCKETQEEKAYIKALVENFDKAKEEETVTLPE